MNFRENILFTKQSDNHNHTQHDGYDIIGDVHGYYTELQMLLKRMGYSNDNGYWMHPRRKAVFVGDFINRGPNSRKVIQAIRAMIDNDTGYAILGNHEINAITYFTKRSDGRPIRMPRNNNRKLLDNFFIEYKNDYEELQRDIKWMRTLPLFLELGKIRIVHAYWNDKHIARVKGMYEKGRLRKKYLKEAVKKESTLYTPFLQTIKGIEINLPKDLIIKDSNNITRTNFRVKWWVEPHGHTFDSLSYGNRFSLPKYTIPNELITKYDIYPDDDPMVFVGHYCVGNGVMIPQKNICCVDACIANGGRLAAYRYSGEKRMDKNRFVFVDKKIKVD
nr:metallophosphoesterase [uncultured Carboxylicivirga sp.]